MGLDTSHDCWHGGYGSFGVWRTKIAEAADVPLDLMEGFYTSPDETALDWAAPREGGPLCGSHYGTHLYHWIGKIDAWLPIVWAALKPDIIHVLLDHSDCDGIIEVKDCTPLADRLEELLPLVGDGKHNWPVDIWRKKTQQFIDGLRLAASRNEDVDFH